jgi:hypothetical protein
LPATRHCLLGTHYFASSDAFNRVTISGAGGYLLDNITLEQSTVSATPEPASMTLLGIGGAFGLLGYRLRRRKAEATPPTAAV